MDFVSLIKPVVLSSDPASGEDGELYFNSASSVYRYHHQGFWYTLYSNITPTTEKVFNFGGPDVDHFGVVLEEVYSGATILAECLVEGFIYIFKDSYINFPIGTYFNIIRAGDGDINIEEYRPEDPENPVVQIVSSSNIYLTAKWDEVKLTKIDSNKWLLSADFRDLY